MAWFSGTQQGLPINVTNRRTLVVAFGDDTADWIGKRVTLAVARVRGFDGGSVHSIVVQPLHEPQRGKSVRSGKAAAPDPLADLDADPELADDRIS